MRTFIGAAVLLAGLAFPALAEERVVTVTVDGTDYALTTLTGSYNDNSATFQAQDWWGDEDLALDIADAIGTDLGDLTGNFPNVGPWSAPLIFGASGILAQIAAVNRVLGLRSDDILVSASFSYVVAYVESQSSKGLRPEKYTLAPDFIPSNVPTCDGGTFVSGFQIVGNGRVQWYVEASKADNCFNVDVNVLPEGVRTYDVERVLAYLGNVELDVYKRQ